MKACDVMHDLIARHLEGTLSDRERADLQAHAEQCPTCRQELEHCRLVGEMVQEAFAPERSAAQARSAILSRLAAEPSAQAGSAVQARAWWRWVRELLETGQWAPGWAVRALAGCALLLMGLAVGLSLGRMGVGTVSGPRPGPVAPMRVADLDGVVLVQHAGSEAWHRLGTNSTVHVGDTFHSAARSHFSLRMTGQSTIAVSPNSMLVLQTNNGQTSFFLEAGMCTAALQSPHPPFFIHTPHGQVEALGTEFTVTVE